MDPKQRRLKILVFGAGAIGSAIGGFLSREHDVTLLGRPKHMAAIRRSGLKVSGIWGRHLFKRFKTYDDFRRLRASGAGFDLILMTVKSYDSLQAAKQIRRLCSTQTAVISLQNGLGNTEALCRFIPKRQVLAGRVIFGVQTLEPGHIKVTVIAEPVALGEIQNSRLSPRVKYFARIFSQAGIPSAAVKNVTGLLWLKVIYNCALNPLASLLGCHYGRLTEFEETRRVMDQVIAEIYDVAKRMKVKLKPSRPKDYAKLFYSKLVPRTYRHRPSMLQDLEQGKPTEIDALNGAIVRLGKRYGAETPVNRELAKLIRQKEKQSKKT